MNSRDRQPILAVFLIVGIIGGGWVFNNLETVSSEGGAVEPDVVKSEEASVAGNVEQEVHVRFHQAAVMLHSRSFDNAAAALGRVLELAPRLPEAHVNMGFAMLGLEQIENACGHFETASVLRPGQANAYYGLAVCSERQGDLEAALGAMRTFLHLTEADSPYARKAQAALWEWEATLGRLRSAGEQEPAGEVGRQWGAG